MNTSTIEHMLILVGLVIVATIFYLAVYYQIDGINLDHATIGGTTVPAVHCEEDEVISWTAPNTLGCVHYEEVR